MSTIQTGLHSPPEELLVDSADKLLEPLPVRGYIHVARPVAASRYSSEYCSRVLNGSVTVTRPS
jgi:hypothetical protein